MAECRWIMVLGAGVMQLPALRGIRKLGWRSIAVDGNDRAVGRELADAFEQIDLKEYRRIAERAAEYKSAGRLDGVFTAGTDFSTSVAYVCEQLNLPGNSFEVARNAKDKLLMRECFQKNGVPSPRFFGVSRDELDHGAAWRSKASLLEFPLIVKPVDNMGARGVRQVEDDRELYAALYESLRYSESGRAIVEERIDGTEYSLDAIVYERTITVSGVANRHIRFAPSFVEVGHTLPAAIMREEQVELERVFAKAIRALGIENGAAKGDIFLTASGAVVGEVAARLSGGYMSGWTYPYASGVELTQAALRVAVGAAPGRLEPRRSHTSAERAFISIPGVVTALEGIENASAVSHVRELFLTVSAGDVVRFPENNVEKCGNVIAAAPTRQDAVTAAEQAVSRIVVVLQPDREESAAFLFPDGGRNRVSAFTPPSEIREAIGKLPLGTLQKKGASVHPPGFDVELVGRDWAYRTVSDSIEQLFSRYGLHYASGEAASCFGRELWQALITGGLQGGIYLVDSIRAGGQQTREAIRRWSRNGYVEEN